MKRICQLLAFILIISLSGRAQEKTDPIRIACVGNSITYGAGIANRDRDSYPSVLGQMLGKGYDVRNFGFSARVVLLKGDYPYMKEKMYDDVLNYNPNIIVLKLGTNDSKPHNWIFKKEFAKDMQTMITAFGKLPAKPKIYLCYPAKAFKIQYGINDSIISNAIIPIIHKLAEKNKLEVIDLHTATSDLKEHFPDFIHPDPTAAHHIAQVVYKAITGKESYHQMQAFPGQKSQWNGCDRYDFTYQGQDAIVVVPHKALKGNPWIWRPAFFGAFPSVDSALVTKGFHVVYYDVTHLYGSPHSVALGTDFYNYMLKYYKLSPKVTLEGFSRGGLFAFNWAAKNPEKVACIYVDAPVCNLFSWPGRKQVQLWNDMLKEWDLQESDMANFKGNPLENLEPIAAEHIPIISVCGDSDQTVPFKENMDKVRSRYLELGGSVEVIIKKGCDHHPHSLADPTPVVNFILRQQPEYQAHQHINLRGDMQNSFIKFEKERKGRVAFLGGSITEMNGWHNMVEQILKQRFPYTEFEFIEAGIGSTGSTPGAFRLQQDILSKGPVDLLFVEAAVNDHTNHFTAEQQIRGMEGEVRHALTANPNTDIVMLHFIYDPFISMFAKRQMPDVILNHERVANNYLIPSINLAQETAERMQCDEFDWNTFGGTHPKPFGHTLYTASIDKFFDEMWSGIKPDAVITPHEIAEPLDKFSYTNGDFLNIDKAKLDKGWKRVSSWHPDNKFEKRKGFVDIPMLEAKHAGDKLTLAFDGQAIGIFCVCGPSAGILEYSIDNAPFKQLDTYTEWSRYLYIPWVYMFETELKSGHHQLVLRMLANKNAKSSGTECQIRNFVVNK
ncbi:MAG: alpha/beta fold hydrolase [Parabacteroides sp.]|nr:alpha/beta fold hydrolase [Parabacteroides sp.]